ncbi:TonB-dependent receptor plug domain-containing protein [Arcobacter sp. CECT 8985]|uniref:TonB-dependent receptor plug domain-containing protein n=1 Tax=Arcobacter sp. CECT 8985 TaxID=1935424 RepID=UPI0013E95C82|nr:TonB-dependent receptor plug domain-containing protein [Arcobacter sp. CECT 8985]
MKIKLSLLTALTLSLVNAEELSVITVDANQDTTSTSISSSKIDKTNIQNSVLGNGFISSVLDTNPNIEVTDTSNNSKTAGEIAPGKISINEAAYYQNNFSIDGISNSSLLDPNLSNAFDAYDVPGNENEIFLDLDLVESIDVYDSNISAEYGSFTGGVIDAKTIRPGAEPSFKASYGYTSDSLTNFHVDNEESFERASSDNNQPKFKKSFYNFYATTPLDDYNGAIISYSRKESTIPGAYFGGFKNKQRLNQSLFGKFSHYFEDDAILDISATYSPYKSTHFSEYVKDSDTEIKGGGFNLKANYEKNYNFWNLRTNLAFKYSENTKESLNYNKRWLNMGTTNWGKDGNTHSVEGGTGNIEKIQKGLEYNLKLQSDSFDTAAISHKLKTGINLSYNKGTYNRFDNTLYYTDAKNDVFVDCNGSNSDCIQNEQYFTERRVYQAEKATADMIASAIYLEDNLRYKIFEFTPGIRLDYNDYLKNKDIAYRLNGSVKPFNDNSLVLYGGFNRYYGKSFLGYKLRQARAPYFDEYRSTVANVVQDWGTSADKDNNKYTFEDLDTPYTDEKSIGIRKDLFGTRINLKYVNREAKSKFAKKKGDYKVFTMPNGVTKAYYRPTYFTNDGYSESDIVTLSIAPTEPIKFDSFNLGYSLSTSWRKTKSNIDDYDDILDSDDSDRDINKIYYNGKFYDMDNIPNESTPKNINLHLDFAFKPVNIFGIPTKINLNNVFRYKLAYSMIGQTGSEDVEIYKEKTPDGREKEYEVPVYEKVDFKNSLLVDLKLMMNFKLAKKHNILFSTEVTNLFDKVQNVNNSIKNYVTGRQIWFNIAYKF